MQRGSLFLTFFVSGFLFLLCNTCSFCAEEQAKPETAKDWKPLFDGKTLDGWTVPPVGGEGAVEVENGRISLGMGAGITGICYKKDFPKTNYEIRYEALRNMGHDFFGSVTFPVGKAHCTFVNGGWGGGTIGLSSIDGFDASDNQTSGYYYFAAKTWYEFRVRVTDGKIVVWIKKLESEGKEKKESTRKEPNPDEPVVNFVIDDHKISLRNETDDFKPIGFATWITEGLIRKIEYRNLSPEEIAQSKKEAEAYIERFKNK